MGPVIRMLGALYNKICDTLGAEHDRLILWVPVCMSVGVAWYFSLELEPPWWLGTIGLLLCAGAAIILKRIPALCYFFIVIALFFFGVTLSQWRTYHIHSPALTA